MRNTPKYQKSKIYVDKYYGHDPKTNKSVPLSKEQIGREVIANWFYELLGAQVTKCYIGEKVNVVDEKKVIQPHLLSRFEYGARQLFDVIEKDSQGNAKLDKNGAIIFKNTLNALEVENIKKDLAAILFAGAFLRDWDVIGALFGNSLVASRHGRLRAIKIDHGAAHIEKMDEKSEADAKLISELGLVESRFNFVSDLENGCIIKLFKGNANAAFVSFRQVYLSLDTSHLVPCVRHIMSLTPEKAFEMLYHQKMVDLIENGYCAEEMREKYYHDFVERLNDFKSVFKQYAQPSQMDSKIQAPDLEIKKVEIESQPKIENKSDIENQLKKQKNLIRKLEDFMPFGNDNDLCSCAQSPCYCPKKVKKITLHDKLAPDFQLILTEICRDVAEEACFGDITYSENIIQGEIENIKAKFFEDYGFHCRLSDLRNFIMRNYRNENLMVEKVVLYLVKVEFLEKGLKKLPLEKIQPYIGKQSKIKIDGLLDKAYSDYTKDRIDINKMTQVVYNIHQLTKMRSKSQGLKQKEDQQWDTRRLEELAILDYKENKITIATLMDTLAIIARFDLKLSSVVPVRKSNLDENKIINEFIKPLINTENNHKRWQENHFHLFASSKGMVPEGIREMCDSNESLTLASLRKMADTRLEKFRIRNEATVEFYELIQAIDDNRINYNFDIVFKAFTVFAEKWQFNISENSENLNENQVSIR